MTKIKNSEKEEEEGVEAKDAEKTLRKKNNQNREREESLALKRVDNKNNSTDLIDFLSSSFLAFWKWDPDPNKRGIGNERDGVGGGWKDKGISYTRFDSYIKP